MKHLLALIVALSCIASVSAGGNGTGGQGGTPPPGGVIQTPVIDLRLTYPELPVTSTAEVDPTAPVLEARWTTADGMSWGVQTKKRKGEGATNQAKRHQTAVKALVSVVGPPAPQPAGI